MAVGTGEMRCQLISHHHQNVGLFHTRDTTTQGSHTDGDSHPVVEAIVGLDFNGGLNGYAKEHRFQTTEHETDNSSRGCALQVSDPCESTHRPWVRVETPYLNTQQVIAR